MKRTISAGARVLHRCMIQNGGWICPKGVTISIAVRIRWYWASKQARSAWALPVILLVDTQQLTRAPVVVPRETTVLFPLHTRTEATRTEN